MTFAIRKTFLRHLNNSIQPDVSDESNSDENSNENKLDDSKRNDSKRNNIKEPTVIQHNIHSMKMSTTASEFHLDNRQGGHFIRKANLSDILG